jgi:hypothetical protein
LNNFRVLLDGLAEVVAGGYRIDWQIVQLREGSAVTAVRGVAESSEAVLNVTMALDAIGESLERGEALPYGGSVQTAALSLTRLVNGQVSAVRLKAAEREYVLAGSPTIGHPRINPPREDLALEQARTPVEAFGAVEGTISTLIDRGRLRFTLYDQWNNRVTCYLESDQHDEVASLWGRRVVVEGRVKRNPRDGNSISVSRITRITPLSEYEEPGSWQQARGSIPRGSDTPRAEDVIRRLRDA